MRQADLAIGAGGATTWERFCMGLPAIVITMAPNQQLGARALADDGLIVHAGDEPELSTASIAEHVTTLSSRPSLLREMSVRGRRLVDGLGATRVADALLAA
jgi:UDP-2,4-diacetamido-2,4,6-trideoxy-beta-L-altropyranose hydrolase